MKYARVVGRVFCTRQYEALNKKKLLVIQPMDWETQEAKGDPLVAVDAVGVGASEPVFWVAARDAAVAFADAPPVDAAIVGIVEGHQARDFRAKERGI